MKEIYKERFIKLYEHMVQPQEKLAHKVFDFEHFNIELDNFDLEENICGTVGCMAGELPYIFPCDWKWVGNNILFINSESFYSSTGNIKTFFGLNTSEVYHLFHPVSQSKYIDPNATILYSDATKEEVVNNLRSFMMIKGILTN